MIVVTAGHVDHGKTRLVQALTGVDTDTLAEEKRRGLSIDLGFAYLPMAGKTPVGFIDVPGHERFLRNALCGLAAADYLLLLVAADDGVMPQTREHLAIIELLGYRQGAIVISKVDRVGAQRRAELASELETLLAATACRDWPRFELSAQTGEGVDALREHLLAVALQAPSEQLDDASTHNFRMPVDRAFEMRGSGLVVTGTVASGCLRSGDSIVVAGQEKPLRARALRVHNEPCELAFAGQRCAINLAGGGLRRQSVRRGDCISLAGAVIPTARFDAELRVLADVDRPLRHWTPVHLHLGTAETTARVAVLEAVEITAGDTGLVQLVCDRPLAAVAGDAFILRDQSARRTLGGGRVFDIFPPRRRRASRARLDWLGHCGGADDATLLRNLLMSSPTGVDLAQFRLNRNLTASRWQSLQEQTPMSVLAIDGRSFGFAPALVDGHLQQIVDTVKALAAGKSEFAEVGRQSLRLALPVRFSPGLMQALIDELRSSGRLQVSEAGYRLANAMPGFDGEGDEHWRRLHEVLTDCALKPASTSELEAATRIPAKELKALLGRASRAGQVVKLSPSLLLLPEALQQLYALLQQLAADGAGQGFTVAQFRDASGIGRNRCIEILESFDARGITRRSGQHRQLLPRAQAALADWQRAAS